MATTGALNIDVAFTRGDFSLNAAFRAEAGLTAFFGRSGCGKTTLVNLIAGLLRPQSGHIAIGERTLFDSNAGRFMAPEKRRIGYVFQEGRLFPHLSVRRNLTYSQRYLPAGTSAPALEEIAELLNLGRLLERGTRNLSGGEAQRVAIGRALLSAPQLLVMDEPLAALDAGHKGEILPYIERLRDEIGIPIIYVSHALEEVIRLADTMVIMDHGRTVASGPVEEIMGRLDLRPLTGRYEAGAVLSVKVLGHDKNWGLTELGFSGGRLWVPGLDAALGSAMRMRIRARDVSLSLTRPADTSILNVLPATVKEIAEGKGPQTEVLLDVGGAPLIARVTLKSVALMELQPGKAVFALVKAAAIDRHTMGLGGTRARQN